MARMNDLSRREVDLRGMVAAAEKLGLRELARRLALRRLEVQRQIRDQAIPLQEKVS